jgi:hypothetical protein
MAMTDKTETRLQKLLEAADLADSVRILKERMESANRDEDVSADRFLSEVRQRLKLKRF